MEGVNVHGLCVREVDLGEKDKLITVVTDELGKIAVMGKGVKSLKSPHIAACRPFSYSEFALRHYKGYYYINESRLTEGFNGLMTSLDKLSLATYICDVCAECSVENQSDTELLRLTLNTLYAISTKDDEALAKIKAAFEFRCASVCGFCPELSACGRCGKADNTDCYLDVMNGRLLCRDCKPIEEKERDLTGDTTAKLYYDLPFGVLTAIRYIVYSSAAKFINFNLDEDYMYLLGKYSEGYLTNHIEHSFKSLEFYKSII